MMKNYSVSNVTLPNGETIAYRKTGSTGNTVLLLHGNMSSSIFWQETMQACENDLTLIAPDLRGFGDSSYNKPINSLKNFAEDMADFLKALNVKKTYVVGWSTGGGIALELAALLKETIAGVLLLDSVGVKGYPMFKKDASGQPILTERLSAREDIAVDAVQVLPILNAYEKRDGAFLKLIWDQTIYNLKQPDQADYDAYIDAMFKQRNLVDVDYSLANFNITHESNGVIDGSGIIDEITCPVLIVHGKKDIIVPIAMADESKAFFGDKAIMKVFEHTGHSLMTDDLPLFVKILKEFVK